MIAANTAFTYRDRPTLRALARELNVGLVVTGSVQRDQDSMSIHASVVDTRDGATVWSEHFRSKMTERPRGAERYLCPDCAHAFNKCRRCPAGDIRAGDAKC